MSKKDHKKNQPTEYGKGSDGAQYVSPAEGEITDAKIKDEGGRDSAKRAPEKIPSRGAIKRLKEMGDFLRKSSNTDRLIATFTGLLVLVAACQGYLSYLQIGTMRKDQRPWIKITGISDAATFTPNTTVMGSAQLLNSGKTPAKNVVFEIAVEKVRKDERPKLDYAPNHAISTTGLLYPNEPTKANEAVQFGIMKETSSVITEFVPIGKEDFDNFSTGEIYYVFYAKVSYTDFFRVEHWTHFCNWVIAQSAAPRVFSARECTKYNDADDN